VRLDVLDDGTELRSAERAGPPAPGPAGRQDVPEQVDGQMTGAWSVRYCARRSDDTEVDQTEARRQEAKETTGPACGDVEF
jgi:hypothetical protein